VANGKGVRVHTQSSCVNEVRLDLLPDYEKKTRSRGAIIYSSLFIQFILTRVRYTVLSRPVLYISLKSPANHRVELGYLKQSEHARSEGRGRSHQASRLACPAVLHRRKSSRSTRGFRSLAKPCPNHTSYPFRDPERRRNVTIAVTAFPFLVFSYYCNFSSFAFLVFNLSWLTIGWRCHPEF